MRFSIVTAFQPTDHLIELAKLADELGYHAISVPDHVVDLETLETPYPYTPDGSRRWDLDADWPDSWVLIGALAAVTQRIRFFNSIYIPSMRNPFQVAKTVGTAAVLSGNRVSLGAGVGWCREEFDLLGEDFTTRGKRTDEGLALMKALWEPGWTEFEGEFYSCPRLMMNPTPTEQIPIYIGGLSEIAFRRAARHDGWVGDIYTLEEASTHVRRLLEIRDEIGATGDFAVITALSDAFLPEHFEAAAAAGVTETWTMPWAYYHGPDCSLEQKLDGLRQFADAML